MSQITPEEAEAGRKDLLDELCRGDKNVQDAMKRWQHYESLVRDDHTQGQGWRNHKEANRLANHAMNNYLEAKYGKNYDVMLPVVGLLLLPDHL